MQGTESRWVLVGPGTIGWVSARLLSSCVGVELHCRVLMHESIDLSSCGAIRGAVVGL